MSLVYTYSLLSFFGINKRLGVNIYDMYYFYVALIYLLLPFWAVFHYIRGVKKKDYHLRWKEYFGFYTKKHAQQVIWIHAASVGEVEAANVLINYFRDNSSYPVLLTTSTEPGYQRVRALQGNRVEHVYLPLDTPDGLARFFNHFQPRLAVIMETEIWPVLFTECAKKSIPLFIVNARLSEKSANSYRKLKFCWRKVFSGITGIIVQTEVDAHRYQSIGASAEKITVSGNLKLDMEIPEVVTQQAVHLKQDLFPDRRVFVVGSTHQGEELLFLNAYQRLKQQFPALLLILVPRQPKRADEIVRLCWAEKLNVIRRTENKPCAASIDVFLVDTLGELKQMYAVADCSFVAGSMVPIGGHNIFEPILLDVPVLFGPYMKNSELLAQQLLDAKGAIQCFDVADIVNTVMLVLSQAKEKDRLVSA
ncbi:MAG: 3-deoxy-D-manno-octulosonic acid transferase, partial [Thiotrichaceae bacterium]|nr:3-deoxy-D-manno-octulosonic acid transferase [Thiotrichaceae bacterium]